jgi:predicted dehydrogenase
MRLAMLGMWHTHADGLVRQVAAHPKEFQLVGFYDPDAKLVARRQKSWTTLVGKMPIFEKPEHLLREPLDGVVVEGRVYENVRLAQLAVDADKPVLLEKPAGDNLDDFRRLQDAAQRKHLHVQMAYLFRYMPAVEELLKRARRGDLGRVYFFRARLPKDLPSYKRYVEELGRYRGGIFFEMAGHMVDMMHALLGRPRQTTPFLAHHHRGGPASFTDNGVAVFSFEHSWASIEVPALEVAPFSRRFEVYGTEGALVIPHLGSGHLANPNIQPIEVYRSRQANWQTVNLPTRPLQISDLREFAACVLRKKQPDFSMAHDLAVQATLLRASGMMRA